MSQDQKKELIAYCRRSGSRGQKWSIARQEEQILSFASSNGLTVKEWFSETASGMNDEREELAKAIETAIKFGLPLIVSSVSRFGRKLSKLAEIIENPNLQIICADIGMTANFLQVCIMSIFAAEERNLLSRRTKQGLQAARNKAIAEGRRFNIGNPVWERDDCLPEAWRVNRAKGRATALIYGGLINKLRDLGYSYQAISRELNEIKYKTPSGKGRWYAKSAINIHKRYLKEIEEDERREEASISKDPLEL